MPQGVPAPNLRERIGSQVVREQAGVRYRELRTRSLVNRCSSDRMPFGWTANPYRGCAMGCRYCYAAYTHEYVGLSGASDFHSTVFVKTGTLDETARVLKTAAHKGRGVALGTATDPYQPGEAQFRVTRRFLELAAQFRGLDLGLTTKGALILRDLELLLKIHERSSLSIHVSLISDDQALLRRIEPWAPAPDARLEVVRKLSEAGLRVALGLAPILPAITDAEADLDRLLGKARRAGARALFFNILFLRSPTREKFLAWLRQEFPRYLPAYERAYAARAYVGGAYERRIGAMLERLRAKHGFAARDDGGKAAAPIQLELVS
jgi:DNA repair photolyase